jgi:hypothetical protein
MLGRRYGNEWFSWFCTGTECTGDTLWTWLWNLIFVVSYRYRMYRGHTVDLIMKLNFREICTCTECTGDTLWTWLWNLIFVNSTWPLGAHMAHLYVQWTMCYSSETAPPLGSSDFGTLTYFKQIWIAVKILRSNYKIRFSLYLAISCENGIFGYQKVRSSLY